MKVIILAQIDYAGSAYKMFKAIKQYTDIDVNLFSGPPENTLRHPVHNLVYDGNRAAINNLLKTADILHFKGDWPPVDGYLGLTIPHKPLVITTSGTFFRKRMHGGWERFTSKDYAHVHLKTSFEPDLLYPEFSDIWTPHPIDSFDKPVLPAPPQPLFLHMPTSPERKGTDFVKRVFEILESRMRCKTLITGGMPFDQAQEMKKSAIIYFDQFFVGFYGNSALEAMQWGVPVCAWISPLAMEQAKGKLNNCPVINEDRSDAEGTAQRVMAAVNDEDLRLRTKQWCDARHSYQQIAKQWRALYEHLLES